MTRSRSLILAALSLLSLLAAAACSGDGDSGTAVHPIACAETADCVARGGFCADNVCRADNQCATDTDCADGSCVADPNFGGLCGDPSFGPPVPLPLWSCTSGADCPVGQGCAEGTCKEDGECTSSADCGAGRICYSSNDDPSGICAEERPPTDPYCRSDGAGACRYECNADGTCVDGATCSDGLCYFDTECLGDEDCTPNHVCEPAGDTGYSLCVPETEPSCTEAPDGVCRLRCESDSDCTVGGGCASDGFCHASNECTDDTDCAAGELCYPQDFFGSLCGPERPE